MIQNLWSLEYEKQIAGVRIQTTSNRYYDIDIDQFHAMGLSAVKLPRLELMDINGVLMTEEEFYTDTRIEEASSNKKLLQAVKSYMSATERRKPTRRASKNSLDVNDPKYQEKRKARLFKIKEEFWTLLPTGLLKEFCEYHFDHFEGNANVYTSLNKAQKEVIREYFRWRSKEIFYQNRAPKVLRQNRNKAEKLVALMGDADDWQYDGTVDTGFLGGGVCELGHPLRYEHYAYSKAINRHIVFGQTCVADFFEIDKSVLNAIVKGQNEILREIKVIVFILDTGRLEDYRQENYPDIWGFMKEYKGRFNELAEWGSAWVKRMASFDKVGLPLTATLRKKYKEMVKQYLEKLKEAKVQSVIEETLENLRNTGLQYNMKTVRNILQDNYPLTLSKMLRRAILNGQYDSDFVKSGVSMIEDLMVLYKVAKEELFITPYNSKNLLKKFYFFENEEGQVRLATRKEIEEHRYKLRYQTYYPSNEVESWVTLIELFDEDYQGVHGNEVPKITRYDDRYYTSFFAKEKHLKICIAQSKQEDFSERITIFNKLLKGEIKHSETPQEFLGHQKSRGATQFDASIPKEEQNEVVSLNTDLEVTLQKIEEAGAAGKLSRQNFVFQVIPTIRKFGRISDKQKKYVNIALKSIGEPLI